MHLRPQILLPLLAALALAACSPRPPAPEPVRAVKTLTVSPGGTGVTHEFAGEVRARTEARLGFRVGGKLVERPAEVGQRVKAGQVLARLDPTDLRLGQDAAAAAVRAAAAAYDSAAADFKRFQALREQGFISAAELERRDAGLKAQLAQLEQAKAQLGVQGNQTGYAALASTGAGVVVAVDAEAGAVVAAGQPVVRVALDGPRDVVFAVPEDRVQALRALQGRSGALQVRLWGGDALLPATVREVAAAADPATRTFLVKADLGRAEVQLGQTLTVVLPPQRRGDAIKLPLTAVLQQQGQPAVWLLDRGSMTVKLQTIAVAGADGNEVVVASGLVAGQTVVTAGVHTLTPGQKVALYDAAARVNGPAGQAPAAAASR